jgi:hypothetical protein
MVLGRANKLKLITAPSFFLLGKMVIEADQSPTIKMAVGKPGTLV